ncbi:MAG: O-acetyl-ADP-ribose deacetylase [Propionibacteriaceae bacterium]|jgi:O-acetyl-ADP-ribose deacetylase (regulator of RNase III)|nr:O-acetyl-ADP-ribose deacetylase [Propionibacteriaceae bacterium]
MLIEIQRGDITVQPVDAIVNAANSTLLGGGGVDGAIHAAAGPALLEECRELRRTSWPDGLPVGQAVATAAGRLPCRWVIHTVGPDAGRGQTDPVLWRACFSNSLAQARRLGARSIAFPAISAGVFGWSPTAVAEAAAQAMADQVVFDPVVEIRFILFNQPVLEAFRQAFARGPEPG